jgi:hypothetical protein
MTTTPDTPTPVTPPKPWWQSKTIWISVLTVIVGATEYLDLIRVDEETKSLILAVIGIATILLRLLTSEPIRNSPKDPQV